MGIRILDMSTSKIAEEGLYAATTVTTIVAVIGEGIISAFFYVFSSVIMKTLARMSSGEGIVAIQSINIVVINPSFLSVFMSAAIFSLILVGFSIRRLGYASGNMVSRRCPVLPGWYASCGWPGECAAQ